MTAATDTGSQERDVMLRGCWQAAARVKAPMVAVRTRPVVRFREAPRHGHLTPWGIIGAVPGHLGAVSGRGTTRCADGQPCAVPGDRPSPSRRRTRCAPATTGSTATAAVTTAAATLRGGLPRRTTSPTRAARRAGDARLHARAGGAALPRLRAHRLERVGARPRRRPRSGAHLDRLRLTLGPIDRRSTGQRVATASAPARRCAMYTGMIDTRMRMSATALTIGMPCVRA